MSSIEKNICDTVSLIVDREISKARYDKTILAKIISCVDETTGKYKIKYQDSIFYAFSNNENIYAENSDVYILIPEGDFNKDKIIVGSTKKNIIDSSSTLVDVIEKDYISVGSNVIQKIKQAEGEIDNTEIDYVLNTDSIKVIYDVKNNDNYVTINEDVLRESSKTKNANLIIIGFKVRTDFDENPTNGNYGIEIKARFKDNTSLNTDGEENNKILTYRFTSDQMDGTPYHFVSLNKQEKVFSFIGENLIQIEQITLFSEGFSKHKEQVIFIDDLEIIPARYLTQEEKNSYSVTIASQNGTYFDKDDTENAKKILTAQVKLGGKEYDTPDLLQQLDFLWFVENSTVVAGQEGYNQKGGQGWQQLLSDNYVINNNVIEIPRAALLDASQAIFKCVVTYKNKLEQIQTVSGNITIDDYDAKYTIKIESSEGEQFYYNYGSPTLTCVVTEGKNQENISKIEETQDEFFYEWSCEDNSGSFTLLPETTDLNKQYATCLSNISDIKNDIDTNGSSAELEGLLREAESELKAIKNNYMRVKQNYIYDVKIKEIIDKKTFKCAVYRIINAETDEKAFLGVASIVLKNSQTIEGNYILTINNGTQVFKYNKSGIAPTDLLHENPIVLQPLSFTIFDNFGRPISDEMARQNSKVEWLVPDDDTLLDISEKSDDKDGQEKINPKFNTYSSFTLPYNIVKKYRDSKTRNNIQLKVEYKGLNLTSFTNFTFLKDGASNILEKSDIFCKIVLNGKDENDKTEFFPTIALYPNSTEEKSYEWNFIVPDGEEEQFKVEVYNNTNLINSDYTVKWDFLKNPLDTTTDKNFKFENENLGKISVLDTSDPLSEDYFPSHLIQALITYDKQTYQAILPLITTIVYNDKKYRISLKYGTGFKTVDYLIKQKQFNYDNTYLFEIKVEELDTTTDKWIDITLRSNNALQYKWSVYGYDAYKKQQTAYLTLIGNTSSHQQDVYPNGDYDGTVVNNALVCTIKINNEKIGRIHIPIHFQIQNDSLTELTNWQGNILTLVNDNDNTELAIKPQFGIGKNNENKFTGLFLGEVIKSSDTEPKPIPGLNAYSDGKQTFHLNANSGKVEKISFNKNSIDNIESDKALINFKTPNIKFVNGGVDVSETAAVFTKLNGTFLDTFAFTENRTAQTQFNNLVTALITENAPSKTQFNTLNNKVTNILNGTQQFTKVSTPVLNMPINGTFKNLIPQAYTTPEGTVVYVLTIQES